MTDTIDTLQPRCAEIIGWRKTGILTGDVLRQFAEERHDNKYDALQRAENDTIQEALELVAASRAQPARKPLTDALVDQIESAARESFRRHQRSIKGQTLTAADNYDWHLLHAAYQAGIDTLRAQLAEAQRDAERGRWLIEHAFQYADASLGSDLDGNPYVSITPRFHIPEPSGLEYENEEWSATDLRAAIDAAKGER